MLQSKTPSPKKGTAKEETSEAGSAIESACILATSPMEKKQSSVVTIFSLWNTMMGVSLLSMPWGLHQAGFVLGIAILLGMGFLCFYTAYLVVISADKHLDFSDICRHHFGRIGAIVAQFFSITVLIGVVIVYWVLMSNFVYFSGNLLYETLVLRDSKEVENQGDFCSAWCHLRRSSETVKTNRTVVEPLIFGHIFHEIWQLQLTVPILLAIVLFPLLNFKSPTFFTKFNVLGTMSVVYILAFNAARFIFCGTRMNFTDVNSQNYVQSFSWNFPALVGVVTMSYFIHNCVLTLFRLQRRPENNVRDLAIGYALVISSYIFVATTFYAVFPLDRNCIEDNLLNNFRADYVLSAVARVVIFFQLVTILPLIMYFIRSQLFCAIFNDPWPGLSKVLLLNSVVLGAGVLAAIFYPNVGGIIRFFGSFSGMMYMFTLPNLVQMRNLYLKNRLSPCKFVLHTLIIVFGVVNLISQFIVN
ncbi:hypothetical protein Q1695_016017 [Nippostrongylus brasiliensis]|nr:hypothetical protein Q1695_016017 [Nippostrongylus brasiliensis]